MEIRKIHLRPIGQALPLALAMGAVVAFFGGVAEPAQALTDQDIASLSLETRPDGEKRPAEEPPGAAALIGTTMLALGVVLALMGGALWAARRWMPQAARIGGRRGPIDILATRAIGPRRSLVLVRAGERTLLLGVTPQSIQTLSEFEPEGGPWSETSPGQSFETHLRQGTTTMEARRP
jgi:flagellar biosynthetic protein FliO